MSHRQANKRSEIIAGTAAAVLAATVILLPNADASTDRPHSPAPASSGTASRPGGLAPDAGTVARPANGR
ncbi:hypothetical protein G3I60_25375 [Streptomyces sp. SID13666]|uniref:hypothetical protein n=1 Tax=unclassified Streptomyces TaxID=2593676 RepID=UPI0013BFC0DC|nr:MULTISPECIES: hypothetical protein [unclassified Streptomyces]NEA57388.1 hypothetical protein [Streptomyces sp. SID13666]